ncbi:T9SS type A sorting domain-containing protein [bacterium]|nr:T9SS type A sorting domain-containing protein [bacterium]
MRNTFLILSLFLFTLTSTIHAQPESLWSRTYSSYGDCFSVINTAEGGYTLAGYSGGDMGLVKTNEDGDSLWSRTFGGQPSDGCKSIIQTTDGGYALAGYTQSFGAGEADMWLVKTNEDGDSLWSKTFGGEDYESCNSIIQTTDGGYALAGYTRSFGAGERDMWLVKTNSDGDSLWSRTFGGDTTDVCTSIIQTADGGYALAGYTTSFGAGEDDMWMVKINAEGDLLWSRAFGGEDTDFCCSITQTTDGDFVLAGRTYTRIYGPRQSDFLLVKTSEDGELLWAQNFGGYGSEWCSSMIQTADGGYALAGGIDATGTGVWQSTIWLLKANADGDSLWSRIFVIGSNVSCRSLIQTEDNCYLLAGSKHGGGLSNYRVSWLFKTCPDPVSVPSESFNPHPCVFALQPAYPNPFNSFTNICFELPVNSDVSITIFDLNGRSVATLLDDQLNAGNHSLTWDAKDYANGMYLCKMEAGGVSFTRKLLLIK